MNKPAAHRYSDFVGSFNPALPTLPAMHSCFGLQFQRVIDTKQILVGDFDPVINKAASFCFYGKPSYRPKSDQKFNNSLRSALYCFVLDYNKIPVASSILPFDSGGYSNIYHDVCSNAPISDYFLPSHKDTPGRVVSAFFGDNWSYYAMKIRNGIDKEIKKLDFHSQGLVDICNPNSSVNYDQRAASIELHYTSVLDLTSDNLLAIVGPGTACEDEELKLFASELEADLIPYELDLDDIHSRQRQVRDAVRGWMEHKGICCP